MSNFDLKLSSRVVSRLAGADVVKNRCSKDNLDLKMSHFGLKMTNFDLKMSNLVFKMSNFGLKMSNFPSNNDKF